MNKKEWVIKIALSKIDIDDIWVDWFYNIAKDKQKTSRHSKDWFLAGIYAGLVCERLRPIEILSCLDLATYSCDLFNCDLAYMLRILKRNDLIINKIDWFNTMQKELG